MYQIKRNHLVEELQFEDNGKTLDISVDINIDSILQQYNKAQYQIAQASIDSKKAADENDLEKAQEAMGNAIFGLFDVVFGHDQTEKIIDFYDNKPLEMLADITPFITDVVAPRVQEASPTL